VQDTDDRYFIGVFRWGFDFPAHLIHRIAGIR
jgi:hypothetical protein